MNVHSGAMEMLSVRAQTSELAEFCFDGVCEIAGRTGLLLIHLINCLVSNNFVMISREIKREPCFWMRNIEKISNRLDPNPILFLGGDFELPFRKFLKASSNLRTTSPTASP